MNIRRISGTIIAGAIVLAAPGLHQPLGAAVPNAWQISDNTPIASSVLYYYTNLTTAQKNAATNSGWRYTVISRLTTDFAGTESHSMMVGDGVRRFGVLWDLNASGHLTVTPRTFSTLTLTTDVTAATNYHVHQLTYTPATRTGTYWFDGRPIHSWLGQSGVFATNAVQWGSDNQSSATRGEMNFYKANFEVMSLGVIASFHAGTAGNPPTAPNPTTQGWKLSTLGTISEGPVSPDSVALPPTVTTLPATEVQPGAATLNAFVFSDELETEYYFEYGATTNYGNFTTTNTVASGILTATVSNVITSLSAPTPIYHFRAVASNSRGLVTGDDQSVFLLSQRVKAWQITDFSTAGGGSLIYLTNLTALQQQEATNAGWRFSLTGRFVDDFGGTETMGFIYGNGVKRFGVLWDFDASGRLVVQMLGGLVHTLLTDDADLYHLHELVYFPSDQTATYYLDRVAVTNWPGQVLNGQFGQAVWGAFNSAGQGRMNFHAAQFSIAEGNVVAGYDASSDEIAPDPVTQGWTQIPATDLLHAGVYSAALSPDDDALGGPTVSTHGPSSISAESAALNGRANPRGASTAAWFEYGLTSGYGSVSSITSLGSGRIGAYYTATVAGLTPGTTYHYRAVATNQFGTNHGSDAVFDTSRFTRVFGFAGGLGLENGSIDWADYDNDGWLDVLVTGWANSALSRITTLWRNTGSGFASVPGNLPDLNNSSVAWGDYNNDGWLDFLLTGSSSTGPVAQLWRNTGSTFVQVSITGLPGVAFSSVAWGDYNNDGRLDFLLTGSSSAGPVAQLWRNTDSTFVQVPITGLPGVAFSSVAWADYDNDGRLDFLLVGETAALSTVSQLWRNTGSTFIQVPIAGLPGLNDGSVAWADYDNDGRLDFLLTGWDNSTMFSQLWRNTGSTFTNVPIAGLPDVASSAVAWGDYDNDGWLDFLLTGWTGSNRVAELWRNTGSTFTKVFMAGGLTPVSRASLAWADYDNDGRLDVLLTGLSQSGSDISQLWRNALPATNTAPEAPSGLIASVTSGVTTLAWAAPADIESGTNLTYNLRVGSAPGGSDVVAPHANIAGGFRRLPAFGNAQLGLDAALALAPGNYYWSVQAVDSAFAGGPFAAEGSFTVPGPPLSIALIGTNVTLSWPAAGPGWRLQESLSLAPAAWSNSPSSATNPITAPATLPTKFYRLFKP